MAGEAIPLQTIFGAEQHAASLLDDLHDAVPASVYLSIYQMAVALRNLFVMRLGGGRFIPLPHFK